MKFATVPHLTEYDPDDAITLREACQERHVHGFDNPREILNFRLLQRWCTKGVRPVASGPYYLFPSYKPTHVRMTTRAWCHAWRELVWRLHVADAVRQRDARTRIAEVMRN